VCRLFATAPAAVFGLAGRKGALAVGADADLVLVDASARRSVVPEQMKSKMQRSALEGMAFTGWPTLTVLRGTVIMQDDQVLEPAQGRFVTGCGLAEGR
jgi:dihydropyrimidinase